MKTALNFSAFSEIASELFLAPEERHFCNTNPSLPLIGRDVFNCSNQGRPARFLEGGIFRLLQKCRSSGAKNFT
jgi:hypothetical protein